MYGGNGIKMGRNVTLSNSPAGGASMTIWRCLRAGQSEKISDNSSVGNNESSSTKYSLLMFSVRLQLTGMETFQRTRVSAGM